MPPPMHARLAQLGYKAERRRCSSASTEVDISEYVEEAFASVDTNKDGKLCPAEIAVCVRRLLPLRDPLNDADTICATIDTDNDGSITVTEFQDFVRPHFVRYILEHNKVSTQELDVEHILTDAFSAVLTEAKEKRDLIIKAFMESKEAVADEMCRSASTGHQGFSGSFSQKWMHTLYEDLYNTPSDPKAPIYRATRAEYLKARLHELIATESEPERLASAPKPNFSPWERRSSTGHAQCLEKRRAAFHKQIHAPEAGPAVKSFCSLWLKKLEAADTRVKSLEPAVQRVPSAEGVYFRVSAV